jgi:hypothetical protein
MDVNADQEDWDSDGVGNACDPDPGEEPGGEGMQGGEMMGLLGGEGLMGFGLPVPEQGAMAYFIKHDSGETSINLSASGGTVLVDLIVATAEPLDAWEGLPAVTTANLVSIDATGWTPETELSAWAGLASQTPPSRYDCGQLYWMIVNAQGRVVCQAWVKDAICADRLLSPGATAFTGNYALDALAGPISTPAGSIFTSASPLGATTSRTMPQGAVRVATLTLNVAPTPGMYELSLTGANYYAGTQGAFLPMQAGPAFVISVGD